MKSLWINGTKSILVLNDTANQINLYIIIVLTLHCNVFYIPGINPTTQCSILVQSYHHRYYWKVCIISSFRNIEYTLDLLTPNLSYNVSI